MRGHAITRRTTRPVNADLFSIADHLRADPSRAITNDVGVDAIPYHGAAYLGQTHEPFAVHGDPNNPDFAVPNLGITDRPRVDRLNQRIGLRDRLDRLSRQVDQLGNMQALDSFQDQAMRVLTSS